MASEKKQLKSYQARRNFSKTSEPVGKKSPPRHKKPMFVIQKHAARNLHYDVRLEIDGVLKSWAVPKGPSTNPTEKRLAIPTEDHPLEYAHFEGKIPPDNYGAGTVMIWDHGTFKNITTNNGVEIPLHDCLKKGRIEVWLEGKKLRGGFALVKTTLQKGEGWLLIKMNDEHANKKGDITEREPNSALSGKPIEKIT